MKKRTDEIVPFVRPEKKTERLLQRHHTVWLAELVCESDPRHPELIVPLQICGTEIRCRGAEAGGE